MLNLRELRVSERLNYSGSFLIMRDAAQRKIQDLLEQKKSLTFDLSGQIVFYAGPTKPLNDKVGIGPTTSERMDRYLRMLFELGVAATVGKGKRSELARNLCQFYKRVYFVAPSGAAAALSEHVKKIELIAFEDLGPEAVYRIDVVDFPLIVAIDSEGNDLFSLKSFSI